MQVEMADYCQNLLELRQTLDTVERINHENPKAQLQVSIVCGPDNLTDESERMLVLTGHPAVLAFFKVRMSHTNTNRNKVKDMFRRTPPGNPVSGRTSRPQDSKGPAPQTHRQEFEELLRGYNLSGFVAVLPIEPDPDPNDPDY